MPGDLDTLVPTVKEIVDELGRYARFLETTKTYDPTTGESRIATAESHVLKVTPPGDYTQYLQPGTTLADEEAQIGVPASGLTWTPKNGMRVTVTGREWRVVSVEAIYTGNSIGLYIVTLRGGEE